MLAKLDMIHDTIAGPLFGEEDARAMVLPQICAILKRHLLLLQADQVVLDKVADILSDIVMFLSGSEGEEDQTREEIRQQRSKDVQTVARVMLLPMVEALGGLDFNNTKVSFFQYYLIFSSVIPPFAFPASPLHLLILPAGASGRGPLQAHLGLPQPLPPAQDLPA